MFELMPKFAFSAFAVAGLVCAAGPVLIHLLNRRRFRVVQWAAMDFLLASYRKQKKWIRLRQLLLLLSRLAVAAFHQAKCFTAVIGNQNTAHFNSCIHPVPPGTGFSNCKPAHATRIG